MSDSEDDYMSDKLLASCETQDVRPGLLFNKSQKRTHDLYQQKIEEKNKKPKTYREQEKELREKGLNTAISADNVGFKLLQKMGYKEGKSLGKTDTGIKEPVKVVLKESSSGVGREKHLDEVVKKKRELKQNHLELCEKEYKAARLERTLKSLLRSDYFKSQRVCEDLDARQGIETPLHPYFWTRETMKKLMDSSEEEDDSDEEIEEEISEENLHNIIDYLRETHWYCLYCGIKGTDKEDLEANCPGPYRNDHSDELD